MSIKSDRWIRTMAMERGMIEPFAPQQVREVDGRPIISYGLSSYGYDIRCANEFKVFTNVRSVIVDQKKKQRQEKIKKSKKEMKKREKIKKRKKWSRKIKSK
jgi:deoxycytidine triphosphate deaminase